MAKTTTNAAASTKGKPIPATSMDYRPFDYFGRQDQQTALLTKVKGTARRNALREALEAGDIDAVPDAIKAPTLGHDVRQVVGSLHPSLMSGEYLPTGSASEVEIARIHIKSTTGDVTSVYARLVGQRIAYRVVDEYEGDTLTDRSRRTSTKALTMGKLIDFFLGAWDLYVCLDCNFEDDLDGMLDFFRGESEFYPCFDEALRDLVRQKFPSAHDEKD